MGRLSLYCYNGHRRGGIFMSEDVTKKKIELEVEVGTTTVNRGINPFEKWVHLAKTVDAWRIFPRIFVGVYIVLLYKVITWFMTLPEPNLEQAGLVSVVTGAMAAVFGIYAGSAGQSKKFKGED